MYVCMHVCMYVYVCVCVCMRVCVYVCMYLDTPQRNHEYRMAVSLLFMLLGSNERIIRY